MAGCFVGSFYLVPVAVQCLDHSDPRQIRSRFRCIAFVCLLLPFTLVLWRSSKAPAHFGADPGPGLGFLEWVGFRAKGLGVALVLPLLLSATLFFGPLVDIVLRYNVLRARAGTRRITLPEIFTNVHYDPWIQLRNIVVAPISEELVFRSLMVPLLVCGGFSVQTVVFGTPVFFGVAHLHHAIGKVRCGVPVRVAIIQVLFQLSYTSIFGAFEVFVLLRTGHFVAVVLCHSFCNIMGFPDVTWLNSEKLTHRCAIGASFLFGMVAFRFALFPLTEPTLYGSHYWDLAIQA